MYTRSLGSHPESVVANANVSTADRTQLPIG